MKYAASDGLILVALNGADKGSGAKLPGIVAYAEMLTHSVPSAGELSQAFTRFLQAGFLSIKSDQYVLREDVRAELKAAYGKQGKWAELPDKAVAVLKQRHDVPVNSDSVALTDKQVADAMQEFRKATH